METFITGGSASADWVLTLLRVVLGVFFAISGWHKLMHPVRRESIRKTMYRLRIPFPEFNARFVPAVEFLAGTFVALGLFTVVSALLLGAICFVACSTDGLQRIAAWKPLNKLDWLDTLLYLPETVYAVLIAAIVIYGPDRFTLDAYLMYHWFR